MKGTTARSTHQSKSKARPTSAGKTSQTSSRRKSVKSAARMVTRAHKRAFRELKKH